MTGLEAWHILSRCMQELYAYRRQATGNPKPWTGAEVSAEVMAFEALRKMDSKEGNNDT